METDIEPKRASTEAIFRFLGDVPWWMVIVAIVGLAVGISVVTNYYYLDAGYFIMDLPWNKDLQGELPVEGDTWCFTPDEAISMRPGIYHLYAEFYDVQALVEADELALLSEPDADAEATALVVRDEVVTFVEWHIIPKEGLRLQQNWVYLTLEDGREGWALARDLYQDHYSLVAQSEQYVIEVPEDAEPGQEEPITEPTDEVVTVETSTPTICGPVLGGVWVRVWDKYNFGQTLHRAWTARGLMLTMRATLMGFGLALVLGLLAGLMLISKNPITLAISKLYVEIVRGVPMLVIILYAGFVIGPMLRDMSGGAIELGRLTGAVLGLAFGYGAYLAEVFRAGIQSIHFGQMEAARSLGMSYFQAMRYVILPQAIRVVLPPLGNDFIAMLKDSSLISVVALPEILQSGRLWVSRTFRGFEGYNTVALFYLVLTLLLSLLVRFIESRAALPGRTEE
jgi:polar amino acid transport system permease protein